MVISVLPVPSVILLSCLSYSIYFTASPSVFSCSVYVLAAAIPILSFLHCTSVHLPYSICPKCPTYHTCLFSPMLPYLSFTVRPYCGYPSYSPPENRRPLRLSGVQLGRSTDREKRAWQAGRARSTFFPPLFRHSHCNLKAVKL